MKKTYLFLAGFALLTVVAGIYFAYHKAPVEYAPPATATESERILGYLNEYMHKETGYTVRLEPLLSEVAQNVATDISFHATPDTLKTFEAEVSSDTNNVIVQSFLSKNNYDFKRLLNLWGGGYIDRANNASAFAHSFVYNEPGRSLLRKAHWSDVGIGIGSVGGGQPFVYAIFSEK